MLSAPWPVRILEASSVKVVSRTKSSRFSYTVTLPERLAEAIRAEVGPGGFSRCVTQDMERRREQERLGELVDWLENEYGPVTEEEPAQAEAERQEIERKHAELAPARRAAAEDAPRRSPRRRRLAQPGPVTVFTSDEDDMRKLCADRVVVVKL